MKERRTLKTALIVIGLIFAVLAVLSIALLDMISTPEHHQNTEFSSSRGTSPNKQPRNRWINKPSPTIDYKLLDKKLIALELKRKKEEELQQILINEFRSSSQNLIKKDNLHKYLRIAREEFNRERHSIKTSITCDNINIDDIFKNSNDPNYYFIKDLRRQRRSNQNYSNLQKDVFRAFMNESCRIYKDRYRLSDISIISLIATSKLITSQIK